MNRHLPPPITANVPRGRLTEAIEWAKTAAPHLVPIYEAIRDFGCGYAIIGQRAAPEKPKEVGKRPIIMTIGDDLTVSMAPAAFDKRSLKRFVRSCAMAVIVSSEPIIRAYAAAATMAAIHRRDVILVETRLQHEIAWLCALRRMNPNLGVLLSTIKAEGSA